MIMMMYDDDILRERKRERDLLLPIIFMLQPGGEKRRDRNKFFLKRNLILGQKPHNCNCCKRDSSS